LDEIDEFKAGLNLGFKQFGGWEAVRKERFLQEICMLDVIQIGEGLILASGRVGPNGTVMELVDELVVTGGGIYGVDLGAFAPID